METIISGELGRINACIDGDVSYSTRIKICWYGAEVNVVVIREECVPGWSTSGRPISIFTETGRSVVTKNDSDVKQFAQQVIRSVKYLIDTEVGGTVKRYGKPTKNFRWANGDYGLTVKNCLANL